MAVPTSRSRFTFHASRVTRLADAPVGQALDVGEDCRVVVLFVAGGAQGLEDLVELRGDRQRHAVGLAGLQRDAEILVVELDLEAGREVVLYYRSSSHLHHPSGGRYAVVF